jgi:acyl-CoA synthetase (AMP-forming)/AMP-acid ligase II
VALSYGARQTTYDELDGYASRVANALISSGVKPGSRIAILDKNSDRFFQLLLGAAKVGAVLLPVNARLAPSEVAFAVNDSEAELLFIGEVFESIVSSIRNQLSKVREVIGLEQDFDGWRDRHQAVDLHLPLDPGLVCLQLYSSGTTGYPKGVQLTHNNFLAIPLRDDWRSWSSDDVVLLVTPLFHIAGVGMGINGLLNGSKIIIHREFSPFDVLQTVERDRVNVALLVPAMLLAMLNDKNVEKSDLSSLRHIIYGTSPIPTELLKRALQVFRRAKFFQIYGLTETAGVITVLGPEDHSVERQAMLRSCGRPVDGVELRVVNADGDDLPVGKVGEILCRTAQNMKGYWKRAEDTSKTLRGGWLHTGDAGYLDQEGYLYIHDRVKDMIVTGGENVYPAEVENALYGHPDIADVAVIGVPDQRWGEAVKAMIVLKPGRDGDKDRLLQYARERLAGYKVPKSIDFVSELPRNPSGKILKRILRESFWAGYERQVN